MKLLGVALIAAALPAGAQEVWRCGPDGRQFQATPCAQGTPLVLRPAPDAAAVAEAQAVVAREQLALSTLSAQRRERERAAVAAAGFVQGPQAAPRVKASRAATAGCGTSPAAPRATPRGRGLPECS